MSLPTMNAFYHSFGKRFIEEEQDVWIKYPLTFEELEDTLQAYALVGLTGCVSSTDCTHVHWDRVPFGFAPNYVGKEKYPTLSFEVSCDRNKKILHVTIGHPGARNDISISKTDEYIQALCFGDLYRGITFTLLGPDGEEVVVDRPYSVVDNGYPKVRGLQCPIKACTTLQEVAYSERAESVRKDIEGCFGVLKGRWRMLRSRILFQSHEKVEVCFNSCCILHNMNLQDDGLDQVWTSDRTWEIPEEDEDDNDIAEAREALRVRVGAEKLHKEGFVEGDGPPPRNVDGDDDTDAGSISAHLKLRKALIVNFVRLKSLGRVVWSAGASRRPVDSRW